MTVYGLIAKTWLPAPYFPTSLNSPLHAYAPSVQLATDGAQGKLLHQRSYAHAFKLAKTSTLNPAASYSLKVYPILSQEHLLILLGLRGTETCILPLATVPCTGAGGGIPFPHRV